jgi:hypothetical protein
MKKFLNKCKINPRLVEKDVNLSCVLYHDVDEPHFFMEALNGENSQHWTKIMNSKFQSLQNNMTWIHTPFPPNHKLVSCKWIFKIKYNVDGFVARHKHCLAARGFTQVEGINVNETFFLVARMGSIQIVFVMTTIENLEVHQMDVKKNKIEWKSFKGNTYVTTSGLGGQRFKIWYVSFKNPCMV